MICMLMRSFFLAMWNSTFILYHFSSPSHYGPIWNALLTRQCFSFCQFAIFIYFVLIIIICHFLVKPQMVLNVTFKPTDLDEDLAVWAESCLYCMCVTQSSSCRWSVSVCAVWTASCYQTNLLLAAGLGWDRIKPPDVSCSLPHTWSQCLTVPFCVL